MAGHDIIVVGTSSGGVEVLVQLVGGLPGGLPATIFVVCHFPSNWRSVLPDILSRSGPLLAQHARDGDATHPGHIYVAPPGSHMLVEDGRVRLSNGPRENNHRPAIDPLFRSAARVYGRRVVGVVLTGALSDGVAGLLAVRAAGGVAVVQDPKDARVPSMPLLAMQVAGADFVVPAHALAARLVELVDHPVPSTGGANMADPLEHMPQVAEHDMQAQETGARRGQISTFSCPECGGCLWQVDENDLVRFRCHVGHAYYGEALLQEQTDALEAALWTAVRTFREKAVLSRQLALQADGHGDGDAAGRFTEQGQLAQSYGEVIQQMLLHGPGVGAAANATAGPKTPADPLPPPRAPRK
ncbi:MAG: chemotaxis protein CheB [Gemmataceae bacterium]